MIKKALFLLIIPCIIYTSDGQKWRKYTSDDQKWRKKFHQKFLDYHNNKTSTDNHYGSSPSHSFSTRPSDPKNTTSRKSKKQTTNDPLQFKMD